MRRPEFSNSDAVTIAKWMVRTRLMETLCETDALVAFDSRIREDFAELVESGTATFAEAAYDRQGRVRVSIHFDDCIYEFGAAALDGQVLVDRRSDYFDAPRKTPRSRDAA